MGVSYFVSTRWSAEIHEKKRMVNVEDNFVNVSHKEIRISSARHNFHEVLLLIDEHNRTSQNILGLEKKWLTKDVCFFC